MKVSLQRMWQKLNNLFANLSTYADLSPDLDRRRQVNYFLRDRPALTPDEWFKQFWQPLQVSPQVASFVYTQLQTHSGLEFSRVQPNDRLTQDLDLVLVCWFDWELSFCEAFFNYFGVDLLDRFEAQSFETVKDLVIFLDHQLLPVNQS